MSQRMRKRRTRWTSPHQRAKLRNRADERELWLSEGAFLGDDGRYVTEDPLPWRPDTEEPLR